MVTITASTREAFYNPVVPTTDFPVNFPIFGKNVGEFPATDLEVEANGELRTDFTIIADFNEGISTNAVVRMSVGVVGFIVVRGKRTPRRTDEYKTGAPLRIPDHNYSLNRLEAEMQEVHRDAQNSLLGMAAEIVARKLGDLNLLDRIVALTSLIGQAGSIEGVPFDTRLAASLANIKLTINTIRTGGFAVAGDGGAALYRRVGSPTTSGFQSHDGAWWEISESIVSPRMFGAKGDGFTDDTTAVQIAMSLDHPMLVDGLFCTANTCNYAGGKTKRVFGSGDTSSQIIMTSSTGHGLSKTNGTLIIESVGITATVDKADNTAAIFIGGGLSGRDLVDNCRLFGQTSAIRLNIGIWCASDVIPTIRNNYIVTCRSYGLLLQNSNPGGGGEAIVTGNTFNTQDQSNTGTAIAWISGLGALRVSSNIIQSYMIGLQIYPSASVNKGSAIITSNSFEYNAAASISINRPSGGGYLQTVNIVGNDFQNPTGRHILVQDEGGDYPQFVRTLNLNGNTHNFSSTGPITINAGYLFSMDGGVFEATNSSLTAVVFSSSSPTLGRIGSTIFAGASIVPYALNGNTGITKVSTTSA